MRSFFIIFILAFSSVCVQAQVTHISNAHVGLFYPVSSNGRLAGAYTNHFSFHLFQGLSASETGFTLAGFMNNIKDSASGVQIAGLVNTIHHHSNGVQIASVANVTGGQANGIQIGGIANVAETFNGLAISGIANISRKDGNAVQIGGILNTAGDVNTQIAGIANRAKKVKGVQVGFVNIADSSDHPIGLINIIRNGDMSVGVSVDQSLTTLATFRSGGAKLYGILGVGYNFKYSGNHLYAMQGGVGAHLIYTPAFKLNAEVTTVSLADFKGAYNMQSGITFYPTMRVYKRMEVFAGPSVNYTLYHHEKGDVHHHYVWSDTNTYGKQGLFIGGVAGIQWTL